MRHAFAIVVGLAAALVAPALAQSPEAERAFAQSMLPELRKALPDREFEIDDTAPLQIIVESGYGPGLSRVNLHRIYNFCLDASAEECEGVRREFLAGLAIPADAPEAAALRIIVRDQQYVDYLRKTLPVDSQLDYRRIGDDLFAILALDAPTTISVAAANHRKRLRHRRTAPFVTLHHPTSIADAKGVG